MAVSPEYRDYILDLLSALDGVTARPMFGGAGIYLDGLMFALITGGDDFYLRVDEVNQPDYEEAGSIQFKPFEDKPMRMPYWQAPVDLLEDEEELVPGRPPNGPKMPSRAKRKRRRKNEREFVG